MTSRFHRARGRRQRFTAEHGEGNLNLVPLVDILTSIVFFSLITYSAAALAALTSFDLALPPVAVDTPPAAAEERELLSLLLAVRVTESGYTVEHTAEGGFRREHGDRDALAATLRDIRARYPANQDVLVIPSDGVVYDDLVATLELVRTVGFSRIALGARARGGATP